MYPDLTWTQQEAIELCKQIEKIAPNHNCHVAITGGLLYKDGKRKDCDILFYRIRQKQYINVTSLFKELQAAYILCPLQKIEENWCIKAATPEGKCIDCLFPEAKGQQIYKILK